MVAILFDMKERGVNMKNYSFNLSLLLKVAAWPEMLRNRLVVMNKSKICNVEFVFNFLAARLGISGKSSQSFLV